MSKQKILLILLVGLVDLTGCAIQPFKPQPGTSFQQANKDSYIPCGSARINDAHLVYIGNDSIVTNVKVYKTYENVRYNKSSDGCGGSFYFMNGTMLSQEQFNSLVSQQNKINSEKRTRAEKAMKESKSKQEQEIKEQKRLSNL